MKHLITIGLFMIVIIGLQSCGQRTAKDQLTLDPVGLIPTNLIPDTNFNLTDRQKQRLATLTSIFSRSLCFSQMQLDLSYGSYYVYELVHAAELLNNGHPMFAMRGTSWHYDNNDSSKYVFDYSGINEKGRLSRIISSEADVAEVRMLYDAKGILTNLNYKKRTASLNVRSGHTTDVIPSRWITDSIRLFYKGGVKVLETLDGNRSQTLTVRYFKDPVDKAKSYLFYDFRKGSPIGLPVNNSIPFDEKGRVKALLMNVDNIKPGANFIAPVDDQPLETRLVLCFQGDDPKYMLHYLYYGEDRADTSALFTGYTINLDDNQLMVDFYSKRNNALLMDKWQTTVVKYRRDAIIDAIEETTLPVNQPAYTTTYDNQYYSVNGVLVGYGSFKIDGGSRYARPIKSFELLTNGR